MVQKMAAKLISCERCHFPQPIHYTERLSREEYREISLQNIELYRSNKGPVASLTGLLWLLALIWNTEV